MARTVRFTPPPPVTLPLDVRLMNGVAGGVFALAGLAAIAAGVLWLTRAPVFQIKSIQLDGEIVRNSVATIRANAMPGLSGNFFSLDLHKARSAFESVPWVRHAVVQRVWPDRLRVSLQEHHAAAIWQGEDGNDRLVNREGEVFEANVGDVEDDGLPVFEGPQGTSASMLAMWRRLGPAFEPMNAQVDTLHLSGRGSWRAELDTGAVLELGRGTEDEVAARCERFVRTLSQVTGRYRQPLEYADLRHADGYALRLRGVTTTAVTAKNTMH